MVWCHDILENDIQQNDIPHDTAKQNFYELSNIELNNAECLHGECRFVECRGAIMLTILKLTCTFAIERTRAYTIILFTSVIVAVLQ